MALALPSRAFGDVQKYLRQKKATGRRVSPTEERSAWGAYWDSMYGMRAEGTRLGLEKERMEIGKEQFATSIALQREQMEKQEKAAMIGGVGQIAGTAAMGAYVLKGTKLGESIGLGKAAATGAVSAAGGAAPATSLVYGSAEYIAAGGSMAPITAAEIAAAAEGGSAGLGGATTVTKGIGAAEILPYAAPAAAGAVMGYTVGRSGTGRDIGQFLMGQRGGKKEHGAVAGGISGAAAGFFIGGPVGAVIGGVLGAVASSCIIVTAATSSHSYEVNVTRKYRDKYLSQQTLRGYYMVAEKIVPLMHKSKRFKRFIKKHLVDHIVKHCEWGIGLRERKPVKSSLITTAFLGFCDLVGSTKKAFVRSNGEVW